MKIMFKTYFYVVVGLLCGPMQTFILADATSIMNQFRAPYSLGEILHEGLVFIENSLEQIIVGTKEHSIYLLGLISDKLQDLENSYMHMHVKSGFNHIKRNERDFLQGLIDRIDQMIQKLETDDSYSSQDQEIIKKNIDLLQNLKDHLND